MNKKWIGITLCFLLLITSITGCSMGEVKEKLYQTGLLEEPEKPDYSVCTGELDAISLEFPTYQGYFILHNGTYYALGYPNWFSSEDYRKKLYSKPLKDLKIQGNMCAVATTQDPMIPTLYLSNGDELVYYSGSTVLDYYTFTKLEDLGFSIPIVRYGVTTGNYVYTYISTELESDIYTSSFLPSNLKTNILSLPQFEPDEATAYMRFYTINGVDLTGEYIQDSLIKGLTRDAQYQLNLALGSEDYQFITKAEYHFFKESELFAEANYDTAYDRVYHIPIPKYLTSGYYMLGDGEIFRLVTEGNSFDLHNTNSEQFNTKVLNLDEEYALANGGHYNEETKKTEDYSGRIVVNSNQAYSSNPKLNYYYTGVPGALGYVSDGNTIASLDNGTDKDTQNPDIETTQIAYFRLDKQEESEESITIAPGTMLYRLVSDSGVSPCMITQLRKDDLYTLDVEKQADTFTYSYVSPKEIKIKDPIYIVLYYTPKSNLKFESKDSRFKLTQVSESEVPKKLLDYKETVKRQ